MQNSVARDVRCRFVSPVPRLVVVAAAVLGLIAGAAWGQANDLLNPSFETGDVSQGWFGISNWTSGEQWGGILVTTNDAHHGTNVMRMFAFGSSYHSLDQYWAATAGRVYENDAWLKTVSGAEAFKPTNGYVTVMLRFYNSSGTPLGSFVDTAPFGSGGPTSWTRYTTGPALAPAGTVTGRTTCFYHRGVGTADTTTNGWVYFDDLHVFTSQPDRAGALVNPGFEVQPRASLGSIPYWQGGFGTDGIVSNFGRNSRFSLRIYYAETLCGQTWVATGGARYAVSGYLHTKSEDKFTSTTNAHGVILLQYLDSTGTNVLQTYETAYFTPNSPSNTWVYHQATGIAPVGTASGRVMCAILGNGAGYGGSIFFDDINEWSVASSSTVAGVLYNPGFEDGPGGNAYDLDVSANLPNWKWLGGTNGGFVTTSQKYEGSQSLSITYPGNLCGQRFAAKTGSAYVVQGRIYNPSSEEFQGSAYGVLYLEYYNGAHNHGTSLVSVVESARFTSSSPSDSWITFSVTNRAPWSGSTTGRVLCAIMGTNAGYAGALYFDGLSVVETNIPLANSQAGALWNPGFEYTAPGTILAQVDNWTALGDAGGVQTAVKRSGGNGLQLYYPGTLVRQDWSATPGTRYANSAYLMTPSGAGRLSGVSNLFGLVILQYVDSTGTNVLAEYTSARFATNAAPDVWTNLEAQGIAPAGTVYGRTLIGLIGDVTNFAGSLYADDVTQRVVSSGTTVSGLLRNPGFEDGPPGNAYSLDAAGDLPSWTWLGGTNGGFITASQAYEGYQSLSIPYPGNLIGQTFTGTPGRTYILSGRVFNPSSEKFTGTANGSLFLQFFNGAYQNGTTVVSVAESARFTPSSPSNQWLSFSVTNRAPASGSITGRVLAAILGTNAGYAGALYFDGLSLVETNIPATNTQAGALWNPGFEYTVPGTILAQIDNWTALGDAGAVQTVFRRSGNNAVQLYYPGTLLQQDWSATQGTRYASSGWAMTPSADRLRGVSNLYGIVILQYVDSTGTNVLSSYVSRLFTTNNPVDVWTNLEAQGVAPHGTVYGRTLFGLLGDTTNFGGSIYFDDLTQRVVSSGGTVSGLLHNPGFEDGPGGNAYDLGLTGDLPSWTWLGGTNGGFITDSRAYEGYQSLSIPYPGNLIGQTFAASTGTSYIVSGRIYNPSSEKLEGSAYGSLYIEFYNGAYNSGTSLVSVLESARFTAASPSNQWVYFSVTNRAPWSGSVTGRVLAAILGTNAGYAGALYFDGLSLAATNIPLANTQSGALWNPGFEYTAPGTVLARVDNWMALGDAGGVQSAVKRSGNNALQIYYPGTLVQQSWAATARYIYSSSAHVMTPAAQKLNGATNLGAVVVMEYLDATGTNVLATYTSARFMTNAPADTWSNLTVSGAAPASAVYGRTIVGLIGDVTNFAGALYVDDLSQALVSTTGTISGLLRNPGFNDGPPGNAYDLQQSTNLPNWTWRGGANAGFIAQDHSTDGGQALVITYPQNAIGQDWQAASGLQYKAEGYLFTPSTAKFNTDGSSWGQLEMTFYINGDTNPVTEYTAVSAKFGASQPANQWIYFAVTGTAPNASVVTGRLTCTIASADPGSDFDLAGVIYFDQLNLVQFQGQNPTSEWEQWQVDNFGSTTGPKTGMQEDYDGDSYVNWNEFIAGTDPKLDSSMLRADPASQAGGSQYVIRWPSASGRRYSLLRWTNMVNGSFVVVSNNIPPSVPQNIYTDAPPSTARAYYYRVTVTTNQP